MSDGMHWYKAGKLADQSHPDWPMTKAGTPRVAPPKAMMVELAFKPSVTSILSAVGGVGGLMNWYAKKGMEASVDLFYGFLKPDSPEWDVDWKEKLDELTSSAAKEGTRFHECIETFLTDGETLPDDIPARQACINVHNWIALSDIEGGVKEHIIENIYCDLPYAGTVDYWIRSNNTLFVIDLKTKNTVKDCRPEWKHAAQCAAYAFAIDNDCKLSAVRCVNIYLSRATGEIGKVKVWTEEEMETGKELFDHACSVWKLINTERIKI